MSKPRCGTCRFFQTGDGVRRYGECRRHPPTIGPMGATWPAIEPTEWCGEYQHEPGREPFLTNEAEPQP